MTERSERHPPYVKIWLILMGLLIVSLVVGFLGLGRTAVILIFGVAVVKAVVVASYYMHLRFEPGWLTVLVLCAVFCAVVLFVGLIPDIAHFYGG